MLANISMTTASSRPNPSSAQRLLDVSGVCIKPIDLVLKQVALLVLEREKEGDRLRFP